MKDAAKVAMTGAVTGLALVLAWQIVSNVNMRKQLRENVSKTVGQARSRAKRFDEGAMLQRARLTNDPGVNQRWVENQWDAII